jgi:hypothetical protein
MGIREEVGGAGQFVTDRRVEALLVGEARRRAVTRMFGVPGGEQSLLVTLILAGSAATVLGGMVARPLPRLSGADAAIGGAALNAGLGAMVGASRTAPLAGGLITFAVVAHAIRPVMSGSARRGRALLHEVRAAYDFRYAS